MDARSKRQKRGAADKPKPNPSSTVSDEFSDGQVLTVLHREVGKLSMVFSQILRACYSERIWNGAPGKQELELKGHTNCVYSVAFSPDGKHIVSVDDRTVRIWNAVSWKQELELRGHTHWVMSVAFSPDGKHVVSGSADATVRIWNAATGNQELELKGYIGEVHSLAFSPDGKHIVSGSQDITVRTWNGASDGCVAQSSSAQLELGLECAQR